ncbi:cation:proton antiporter [Anabaena cylindrica UHCC 0172]|uniref:cation:proton antiporter n=1 Tax=Anabaena cylindrica TaxID=1165 RepID=UPI002B204DE7|nr:cation:proton antiporter [Anabaena cylindrica]MEA5553367.1 cation:proton antiporter [Anabaena cylindrica UHCC 0172]
MIENVILRLTIWFLLTSDFSVTNIIIGVIIAFILPRGYTSRAKLTEWLKVLFQVLVATLVAFKEAFEIILYPHNQEEIIQEEVKHKHSSLLVFMDIFLITFTPKTIVVNHNKKGFYEVHRITRKGK